MSGPDDAPRGWWRPSVVLAGCAVSFALLTLLPREQPAPKAEMLTEADAAVVSEFSGVATVGDGDTIRLGERRIRFDGIIAPGRSVQCGGVNIHRASGDALREVTRSQRVVCQLSDVPDAQGRDMAVCRVGDINLNEYMVANGWARDWPRHSGGAYADEEATARGAQRGVWSPSCPADLWRGSQFEE